VLLGACVVLGPAAAAARAPAREVPRIRALIWRVAQEERVDARALDAIIQGESGYDNRAVGRAGEIGMGQVMRFWARKFKIPWYYLFDEENNVRAAARVLRGCHRHWKPRYAEFGRVHRELRKRLRWPLDAATFSAGCYNHGRLGFVLGKTPRRRWSRVWLPKRTVGYMARFQKRYRKRLAAGLSGPPRPASHRRERDLEQILRIWTR